MTDTSSNQQSNSDPPNNSVNSHSLGDLPNEAPIHSPEPRAAFFNADTRLQHHPYTLLASYGRPVASEDDSWDDEDDSIDAFIAAVFAELSRHATEQFDQLELSEADHGNDE